MRLHEARWFHQGQAALLPFPAAGVRNRRPIPAKKPRLIIIPLVADRENDTHTEKMPQQALRAILSTAELTGRTMIEIPARKGKAVRVRKGQRVKVVNTTGQQVVDTWAFSADDLAEFMSMEHSRVAIGQIIPAVGDTLVTNRRRPILTLIEDTSGGIHDTLFAACDRWRYETARLHRISRQLHRQPRRRAGGTRARRRRRPRRRSTSS